MALEASIDGCQKDWMVCKQRLAVFGRNICIELVFQDILNQCLQMD